MTLPSITLADIEAARRVIAGQVLRTPMLPAPRLSALTGAEVLVKYENLQVTNSFKERGALVKLAALTRGRARARRHRHVGRQSRPGGRLSCGAARHSGDHRDAGDDAVREGRGDQRRYGAPVVLDGETVGEAQARAEAERARARADLGASVRRSACDRRAGHDRAGDAGGGARSRHAGDPDRRRRPDRRHRDRGQGAQARRSRSSASSARSIRRCGTRIHGENRPLGGATLAEGIAVKNVGGLTLPIVRALVADIVLVDEEHIERAVNAYPHACRRRWRRAPARPGLPRCWPSPERFAASGSGWCCAAATSIRGFSPRSWCASWSASTASCRSG